MSTLWYRVLAEEGHKVQEQMRTELGYLSLILQPWNNIFKPIVCITVNFHYTCDKPQFPTKSSYAKHSLNTSEVHVSRYYHFLLENPSNSTFQLSAFRQKVQDSLKHDGKSGAHGKGAGGAG